MFSCAASRLGLGGVYWLVTEERLLPQQLEDFYQASTWYIDENNPDTNTGVLQMTGTALIHNTSVQCFASYPYGDSIFSDKVYLKVQGMHSIYLVIIIIPSTCIAMGPRKQAINKISYIIGVPGAPNNLAGSMAISNRNLLSLTWTPPSVLLGSVQYRATVFDGSQTGFVLTSHQNATIDLCDLGASRCAPSCNLNVSVTSINSVGDGETISIEISAQQFSCDGDQPGIIIIIYVLYTVYSYSGNFSLLGLESIIFVVLFSLYVLSMSS